MAPRNRLSRLFGGGRRPEPPRPGRANETRTVGAPGRISGRSADWERSTPAPEWVNPAAFNYVPHWESLSVEHVHQGTEWGSDSGSIPVDDETPDIQMQASSSSNRSRPRTLGYGYDYETETLRVEYRDHAVYDFHGVTPTEWSQIYHAWSTGRQMNAMHLNGHEYERIA